jgi:hypothetical protein
MKPFSKQKRIRIFRNTDNKQTEVDTIEEAMSITGCNANYIRRSATNPLHYSNRADDWQPVTLEGNLRTKTPKPLFRFEYIEPVLLTAWPMFESDITRFDFKSYYSAIKTINCAESTFYLHKRNNMKYIIDKNKRLWKIEWKEVEEYDNSNQPN